MSSKSFIVLTIILGLGLQPLCCATHGVSSHRPHEALSFCVSRSGGEVFEISQVPIPKIRKPIRPLHIQVTAPLPGIKFRGSDYPIRWKSSPGHENTALSIFLLDLDHHITHIIVRATENDGVFMHWQVTAKYRDGRHRIAIRKAGTQPGPLGDQWTSATFTIGDPFIRVMEITPRRTAYPRNMQVFIHWEKLGPMSANQVSVTAVHDRTKARTVINEATYNGSGYQNRSWAIPASMAPGIYRIHVCTLDNRYEDYSPPFTID